MGLFGVSIGRWPGGNVSHGPRGFPGGRSNGYAGRGRRDAKPDAPSAPQHGTKQPRCVVGGWGVGVPGRGGHTPVPGPSGGRKLPIQNRVAAGTWPQKVFCQLVLPKKKSHQFFLKWAGRLPHAMLMRPRLILGVWSLVRTCKAPL